MPHVEDQDKQASTRAVDPPEFLRFVLTGVVATLGNLAALWVARHFVSYRWALVAGIGAGSSISFIMSKLFAFRSRQWGRARGEAGRFLLVYGVGVSIYWVVSLVAGSMVLPRVMPERAAELLGVLIGAGVMTVTGYFGHRFYTYRRTHALG